MDNGLRRYTAEEIQAALGDGPFVVRDLWPRQAGTDAPSIPGSPKGLPPPKPLVEAARAAPRSLPVVLRPGFAAGAEGLDIARRPRRWPAPRRWPLVLLLTGTALSAGCVAVWMLPPSPPALATARSAPAPMMLAAMAVPEPLPTPRASDPELGGGNEAPRRVATSDAPLPDAEPPLEAPADAPPSALAPEAAAPVVVAAIAAPGPVAAPDAPRPSNPVLATALMRRADDALARGDIAAARAFFVRAASVDPWSVEALVGAGKTYDPGFLHPLGVTGGLADRAEARRWYTRASQLGDPTAAAAARRLGGGD